LSEGCSFLSLPLWWGGWHIVSGATDVTGGVFHGSRATPPGASRHTRASFARLEPTKIGGGMNHPRFRDARAFVFSPRSASPSPRKGARLALSYPSHFCGVETSKARSGVARSAGWVASYTPTAPPCTSFAPLTICFPSPQSGRDEDRRWRGTVRNDTRAYLQRTSAFSPRWPREFCIV
jgi:hypothetical protein